MGQTRLTSEVINYKRIELGEAERNFMFYFSFGPITAYRICSRIEETISLQQKRPVIYDNVRKRYKNVHKRVGRLHDLELIQEVKGDFPKKAKPYKLTSQGLFQYLLLGLAPTLPRSIFDTYKNDIIIESVLYRYFELATISEFSDVALSFVRGYLRKCCEAILRNVESSRRMTKKLTEWKNSKYEYDIELLSADIDQSIRDEIRTLLFQIVTLSGYDEMGREANDSALFPVLRLVRDKKFMQVLNEMRNDFNNGCKNFY